jgi:hypothetical protein
MEDFVTWVDTSKLKRTILAYNDEVRSLDFLHALGTHIRHQLDDFDLL